MAVTSRSYRGEQDYSCMRDLLVSNYALTGAPVYATIGDLDWWRYPDDDPNVAEKSRLWLNEQGDVIGFAWPSRKQVDIIVHTAYRFIEDSMLAWAEDRRRSAGKDEPESVTLTAWAFDSDRERSAILQCRGYERSDYNLCFRFRNLDASIPAPTLPDKYRVGRADEQRIELRVDAHQKAFGSQRMTEARYRSVIQAPTYRPDLDIVIIAPDETVAAFAVAWFDSTNRVGSFEPVGTHPIHQRLGLGRAIMLEGMRRLQSLGAQSASVVCGGHDVAANGLYAAVGMAIIDRNRAWTKLIG